MTGTRCTVAVCNNSLAKTKQDVHKNNIKYFNFPKSAELRRQWVQRCRREGKWNPDSCRVCSEHFIASDFERDLKNELLGLPLVLKLRKDAVPSVNLGIIQDTCKEELSHDRARRKEKRDNRKSVVQLLQCSQHPIDNIPANESQQDNEVAGCSQNVFEAQIEELKKELLAEKLTNKVLKCKLQTAERKLTQRKTSLGNIRSHFYSVGRKRMRFLSPMKS